jgi:hypothetical protein
VNAGEGYCVNERGGEEGERERERERSVQGRCDYTTALDIEVEGNADALAVTSPTLLFRPM